jgi:glutamine cyclotransferase
MNKQAYILLVLLTTALFACNSDNIDANNENAIAAPTALSYELIKVYPHDTSSYTQGLEWNGNKLIESTGLEGKSVLQVLDSNMKPLGNKVKLDKEYFGEGTTLFQDKIYQLTWKTHKVFVYDAKTLKKTNELYWPYEGWGLTHNDTSLIVSTGESNIYFVNPIDFSIQKTSGIL